MDHRQRLGHLDRISDKILIISAAIKLGQSQRKQSLNKSTSFKEQSASVTSVKNILENYANNLMSGKELLKLVTFVKGTQFDLVVLFDIFQHNFRLWKAYSTTLQSHPPFAEYHDLLEHLEEKLASVANIKEI